MPDLYTRSVDQRVMFLGFAGMAVIAFFAYKMVEIGQPFVFFCSVGSAALSPVIILCWILWFFEDQRRKKRAKPPTVIEVMIGVPLGILAFTLANSVMVASIPQNGTMHHTPFAIVFCVACIVIEIANSQVRKTQVSAINFGIACAIVKCAVTYA